MVNIGVIGLGIGAKHVESFLQHKSSTKVFVTDFSEEKLKEIKSSFPLVNIVSEAKEIIDNPEIDIISIASYDQYHFSQMVQSLKKGKHVFVEKPFCMNFNELKIISKLIKEKDNLVLSSNLVLRTEPLFNFVKGKFSQGEFGDIINIEADYLWGRKEKLLSGWRNKMSDYSIILGASIHMIDLIMWIKEERPTKVSAFGNRIIDSAKEKSIDFDSFSLLILEFPNGSICKISGHGSCIHPHFHALEIFGTKSTFLHNLNGTKIIKHTDKSFSQKDLEILYPSKSTRKELILNFMDVICGSQKKQLVDFKDIKDVMSVCFSAIDSLKSGTTKLIKYVD